VSRKVGLFAGLGLVGLLVSGLVAGVALAQGGGDGGVQVERQSFASRVASHLGVTEQQVVDAAKTARLEMLEEAVAVGKISPEDAEQIRKRIEESQGLGLGLGLGLRGWRVRALGGGIVSSVAETLDMTPSEILQDLKQGQSLGEIGQAKGVSADTLKSAILAAVGEKLDQAVANGRLAQEQADEITARLTDNVDKILNWKRGSAGAGLSGSGAGALRGAGLGLPM
jgi:lambda repressor-like predicted transcriptional regulator